MRPILSWTVLDVCFKKYTNEQYKAIYYFPKKNRLECTSFSLTDDALSPVGMRAWSEFPLYQVPLVKEVGWIRKVNFLEYMYA